MKTFLYTLLVLSIVGCAAEPPHKVRHPYAEEQRQRHDFEAPWIFAIGSVDWPEPVACSQALEEPEMEPDVALAVLRIRRGAGFPLDSVGVSAGNAGLAEDSGLLLKDTNIVVEAICGKHPDTVDAYLDQRRECSDGAVELLTLEAHATARRLRRITLPFANDATVSISMPWLHIAGESQLRRKALAKELAAQFDADLKTVASRADVMKILVRLLRKSEELGLDDDHTLLLEVLRDKGELLRQALPVMAAEKVQRLDPRASSLAIWALGNRLRSLPLADLDANGEASIGERGELAGLALSTFVTSDAYRKAVKPLQRRATRVPDDHDIAGLVHRRLGAQESCATANQQARVAMDGLRGCALNGSCTALQIQERVNAISQARRDFLAARREDSWASASQGQSPNPKDACRQWSVTESE